MSGRKLKSSKGDTMKKLLWLGFALMFGAAMVFMFGCDSTSSNKETGSLDDPEFEVISDIAGEGNFVFDMLLLDISFNLLDSIQQPLPVGRAGKFSAVDDDVTGLEIINYKYSNFWHIFTCSVFVEEIDYPDTSTFSFTGIDSIRLANDEGYMRYEDMTTNAIDIHAHFQIVVESPDVMGEVAQHAAFHLAAQVEDAYTIDGSSNDSIMVAGMMGDAECEIGLYFDQSIDGLLIDEAVEVDDVCPLQGEVVLNFTVDIFCVAENPAETLDVSGGWWAKFVFDNGFINAVYENETTRWTFSEQCREAVGKRGWTSVFDK